MDSNGVVTAQLIEIGNGFEKRDLSADGGFEGGQGEGSDLEDETESQPMSRVFIDTQNGYFKVDEGILGIEVGTNQGIERDIGKITDVAGCSGGFALMGGLAGTSSGARKDGRELGLVDAGIERFRGGFLGRRWSFCRIGSRSRGFFSPNRERRGHRRRHGYTVPRLHIPYANLDPVADLERL